MSDDNLRFRVVAECCGFDCIPEECPLKQNGEKGEPTK